MKSKYRLWTALMWLALAALFVAACSSTTTQNPGGGNPSQTMMTSVPGTMMTSVPGTMMTQVPGGMMGSTPGAEVPDTGKVDIDQMFINMMVPHHQGAVEMARVAQQRAEHPEIKQMAEAIIAGQQEEITQMKAWKQDWYGSSDTPPMSAMPMIEAMPGMGGAGHTMNMQADVDALKNAADPFDLAFIDAMIPHHQSAIDAAEQVLNQATHPEIKDLAQKIIDAQQKEIDQMNEWRQAWYPDAPPATSQAQ